MPKTTRPPKGTRPPRDPMDWRTPEQRKAYERQAAKEAAMWSGICGAFKTWTTCGASKCRRRHACLGDDAHACFHRYWDQLCEEERIWFRAGIKARVAGLPPDRAIAAANEALAQHLALEEALAAPQPGPPEVDAPSPPGSTAPSPRLRGL